MRMLVVLGVVLVAAGCGGEPPSTEEPRGSGASEETGEADRGAGGRVVDGFYTADGAPDPLACASDDECAHGGVLAANGCCWSFRDMNAVAMSTAYRDWSTAQRESCDVTQCPPPPVPSEPPDCLFQVRCADGSCVNACE